MFVLQRKSKKSAFFVLHLQSPLTSMEAAEFKNPSSDFPPPKSDSRSPRSSSPNGFHSLRLQTQDIEMTAVQPSSSAVEYTSLKDLLPSAPAMAMSPTPSSSWHEIPIRNPLVKHAAMAYLQPMSTPTTSFGDREGILWRLKEMCLGGGGEYGCFGWLCDVVSRTVKEVLGELVLDRRRRSDTEEEEGEEKEQEEEDSDEDEEYEDNEKVD